MSPTTMPTLGVLLMLGMRHGLAPDHWRPSMG